MAITANYILMCDDVRREDNGKLMLIGMYPSDMTIPQIPIILPTLTFCCVMMSDRPGNFRTTVRLRHEDGGRNVGEAVAMLPVVDPRVQIVAPIRFAPVQINSAGLYTFSLEIEGQQPIVHPFSVQLVIPGAQQGLPGSAMGR